MTQRLPPAIALIVLVGCAQASAQSRSAQPRVTVVQKAAWTADVRAGIESFGIDIGDATNLHRVLANHPPALHGIGPLAAYLRQRSMVTVVDQLLIGLRAAWLCRSEAIWAEMAAEARSVGLDDVDLRRIARGPDAGWGEWDATILRATDDIYHDSILSDASWRAMATRYDVQQLMDIIFTGAEFVMLSMMANSYGVQPDARFPARLPTNVVRETVPARANLVPLMAARLDPLPRDEWSDEVRELLDPNDRGVAVLNLYATLARPPIFFRPRAIQSAYIRLGATLSARAREILILRIGWLCGSEYEWAQHVGAARRIGMSNDEIRRVAVGAEAIGWDPFEAALIRATDELYHSDTISDETWTALSERYDTPELIDVVITVAGYRMVSIALNSIGTQLEPDRPRFPDLPR